MSVRVARSPEEFALVADAITAESARIREVYPDQPEIRILGGALHASADRGDVIIYDTAEPRFVLWIGEQDPREGDKMFVKFMYAPSARWMNILRWLAEQLQRMGQGDRVVLFPANNPIARELAQKARGVLGSTPGGRFLFGTANSALPKLIEQGIVRDIVEDISLTTQPTPAPSDTGVTR